MQPLMGDGTKTALAASIAAGYLLGRGRKAKLAVALGACLASGRLRAKPGQLLSAGAEKMSDSPQLSQLADQLRGDLLNAGRYTLKAAMDKRLGTLADSLASRTESLSQVAEAAADQDQETRTRKRGPGAEQEPNAKQEDRDVGQPPLRGGAHGGAQQAEQVSPRIPRIGPVEPIVASAREEQGEEGAFAENGSKNYAEHAEDDRRDVPPPEVTACPEQIPPTARRAPTARASTGCARSSPST